MDNGSTTIPNRVVDIWMRHTNPSQFRLLMVMLRHGYHGSHALPRRERHRLPAWLGLENDTAYRTLKQLVREGAIEEVPDRPGSKYRLRLDWMPPSALLEDAP